MRVVAAIDFSDSTPLVANHAGQLAKGLGAELFLLHVAPPNPDFVGYEVGPQSVRDKLAEFFHEEHQQLQDFASQLRGDGIEVTALLLQGPTVDKILEETDRLSADMLVVGSHGHGLLHTLLVGSTSEGILHHSKVPVLVIPTHQRNG